jgi:hypothetical protein
MRRRSFPWGALLLGLVLGLAAGLVYAWFLNPVRWVNIAPDRLNASSQREYILLTAEAYMQDGDIDRARARLAALDARDIGGLVAVNADSALLRGADARTVRALSTLAEALGASPQAADIFSGTMAPTAGPAATATPAEPEEAITLTPVVSTPTPTIIPTVTITPNPFAGAEFGLIEREITCEDDGPAGWIEVYVYGAFGESIPGIEVLVTWSDGQDTFFTGLKPEIDAGYADFDMTANTIYSVTLVDLSEPVLGIGAEACTTPSGRTSIPTYRLVFVPASSIEE